MRTLSPLMAIILLCLPGYTNADTIVIVDTFLQDDRTSGTLGVSDRVDDAISFVPDQSGYLAEFWLAISNVVTNSLNEFDVYIMDDRNGQPGDILESYVWIDLVPIPPTLDESPIYQRASGNTILNEGERYWISLSPRPGTDGGWRGGIDPDNNTRLAARRVDDGDWVVRTFNNSHAFRVAIHPLRHFNDVSPEHWAFSFIESLARSSITGGCGNDNYCPADRVTRAQMAVFLERGMRGSDYSPPVAAGNIFLDVSSADFAAAFIEQLFNDGITGGCGGNNYCPNNVITRAQMAVFLLRARYGSGYMPPPPTGTAFNDVDLGHWAVAWIEQLTAEGVTGGCGNGNYCPDDPVDRAQMAVFLVRTFGL